ncbi:MAG: hypothetical protein WC595_04150 [Candidatus Nanoarchaeia archaeon]
MVTYASGRKAIETLQEIHNHLALFPKLSLKVEAQQKSLKWENELFMRIEYYLIENWLDEGWPELVPLFAKKLHPCLILFILKNKKLFSFSPKLSELQFGLYRYVDEKNKVKDKPADIFSFIQRLYLLLSTFQKTYWNVTDIEQITFFWENYKPKKTRYQRKIPLSSGRKALLRMIFLPNSKVVNIFGKVEEDEFPLYFQYDFFKFYLAEEHLPQPTLDLFFEKLCQTVTKAMNDPTITRNYSPASSLNLQIELRPVERPIRGIFSTLLRKKKNISVTFTPNSHDPTITLTTDYLFNQDDLEDALYHELIHNLDALLTIPLKKNESAPYESLRAELVATLFTVLYNSSSLNLSRIQTAWEKIKTDKITTIKDYEQRMHAYGGSIHDLSFLMGLQLLLCSLKIGNGSEDPTRMFELISSSRLKAIERAKTISALSTPSLFKYYKQKVPEKNHYLTEEFLDEIIELTNGSEN